MSKHIPGVFDPFLLREFSLAFFLAFGNFYSKSFYNIDYSLTIILDMNANDLLFFQVVQDTYSSNCCRMNSADRRNILHLLRKFLRSRVFNTPRHSLVNSS